MSKVKFWRNISICRGIAIIIVVLAGIVMLRTLMCTIPDADCTMPDTDCTIPDTFLIIWCSLLDMLVILFGATLGALLGYHINEHEKKKR